VSGFEWTLVIILLLAVFLRSAGEPEPAITEGDGDGLARLLFGAALFVGGWAVFLLVMAGLT
jgi:hypothetical protein